MKLSEIKSQEQKKLLIKKTILEMKQPSCLFLNKNELYEDNKRKYISKLQKEVEILSKKLEEITDENVIFDIKLDIRARLEVIEEYKNEQPNEKRRKHVL